MTPDKTTSQHETFRVLLQAMSRPGSIQQFMQPSSPEEHPLLRLLDCILDNEVCICGIGSEAQEMITRLHQQMGCRLGEIAEADFVIVSNGTSAGQLASARVGTPDYPDSSVTVVYLIEQLTPEGSTVILTGPGIKETVSPVFSGLALDEFRQLQTINSSFPLGMDAIFVDRSGQCCCIPRSTVIQVN